MAKKKAAKKAREMMLVQSKVKEYVRGSEMMCSGELIEALNEVVGDLLDRAVARADGNGRKTVKAQDI
ncbi:MAG: hypothetical protein AAFN74_18090 [Myxococcota bacterium]